MDPLSLYYVHQAGGGGGGKDRVDDVIGPIYAGTPFVHEVTGSAVSSEVYSVWSDLS
jgi:hypothetical protein